MLKIDINLIKVILKKIYYKNIYHGIKARNINKRYKCAVIAIFKNEAPYLKEWIEYNHIVGIEHFYLYNNNSTDEYMKILEPYIEMGLVTLENWPYDHKQMGAYIDGIKRYRDDAEWIGFIDIDEFIVPKDYDNIYDFLNNYKNKGAVLLYWRVFGTSGNLKAPSGYVTENYYLGWKEYSNWGKCFYNTAFDFDASSVHSDGLHHVFWANFNGKDIPPVNTYGEIVCENKNRKPLRNQPIQINHYFTKSYEEYMDKKNKGDVYFKINPHDEEYFWSHEKLCTYPDYSAYKFLYKLKQKGK